MTPFNGLAVDMSNLHRVSDARTRSITPENPDGSKGRGGMAEPTDPDSCARELGRGWKVRPNVRIQPGETHTIADIEGPGAVQSIWMTPTGPWRFSILRIYWDGQQQPSVECPLGDFFACGWNRFAQVTSLAVCVNPGRGFNCYWTMPFRKRCRITMENIGFEAMTLFYQVNYALNDVPDDTAYFHAQFRRVNPLPYKQVYTVLDGVKGKGHYVGTYMAWGVNNSGWWGEGEVKFYLDGDLGEGQDVAEHGGDAYPTLCGTGTEDYFCGAYNFEDRQTRQYLTFSTPYAGLPQILRPDGAYQSQQRFSMYRWHIPDPIRFEQDIAVTVQALGWRSQQRYLALQDDIASVAYWYQQLPTAPFPELPARDMLEII
ncbi:glycoside hydrolase family 172 protein [Phycisphaerales bacterium AB-hyl4]|uniref:Glycoside hydrolase family 172 protein n=1 Tax=Natronomicrosphaera hydrolytica TaxID=3242702 RepID=A0ABV4U2X0_9BACT